MIPIIRVAIKCLMVSPPKKKMAKRTSNVVKEVLIDLDRVALMLVFTTASNSSMSALRKVSLVLSKVTIVSCTENPKMVSRAVMNKESTPQPV